MKPEEFIKMRKRHNTVPYRKVRPFVARQDLRWWFPYRLGLMDPTGKLAERKRDNGQDR